MTELAQLLEDAGLTGRGGAAFPTAIKIRAAIEKRARLIVNVCDGELGAAKDGWIVEHHLDELLDGVRLVAGISPHTRFAAHRGSATAARLAAAGLPVLETPDRYVSSEETSLISLAHGGQARPMTKRTPFVYGGRDPQGRRVKPTVVLNAETLWRISQINQHGAQWFRSFGTQAEPGPRLVAIGGYVARPGVYESAAGTPLAEVIALAGGMTQDVRHLGIGGLGGIVMTAAEARYAIWDTPGMKIYGGSIGPGIITIWNPAEDPVDTVNRMLNYGAAESAGQCGPCMFGLPALAEDWRRYVDLPSGTSARRLTDRVALLNGRGACAHPMGVARFATSALRVLEPELTGRAVGRRYLEGATRG